MAFIMVPLGAALAGRNAAADESTQSIGAALAEAGRHRGFWLLTASFFVCGFQTIFVMTHLPAYLVDRGLTAGQGMTALAVIGLFNILGSYGCGALGGRYSKRLILAWIYVVRAVAIGVFLAAPLTAARHVPLRRGAGPHLARHRAAHQLARRPDLRRRSTCRRCSRSRSSATSSARSSARGQAARYSISPARTCWSGPAAIGLSVVAAALCVPIDERALVRGA